MKLLASLWAWSFVSNSVSALQCGTRRTFVSSPRRSTQLYSESRSTSDGDKPSPALEDDIPAAAVTVERVIKDNYPDFHALLSKNQGIFRTLEQDFSENGYTIFAPTAEAFAELSSKQRMQMEDPRNLETAQKMGLYHIVKDEALSLTKLNREDWTVPKTPEGLPALKFSALVTMGGEVPIGRFKKKTDGSFWRTLIDKKKTVRDKDGKAVTEIVVGPAGTILRSVKVGNAMIHEVDGFVSPLLLWRYFSMPGL